MGKNGTGPTLPREGPPADPNVRSWARPSGKPAPPGPPQPPPPAAPPTTAAATELMRPRRPMTTGSPGANWLAAKASARAGTPAPVPAAAPATAPATAPPARTPQEVIDAFNAQFRATGQMPAFWRESYQVDPANRWWEQYGLDPSKNYFYDPAKGWGQLTDPIAGEKVGGYSGPYVGGGGPADYAGPYIGATGLNLQASDLPAYAQLESPYYQHSDKRLKYPGYRGVLPDSPGSFYSQELTPDRQITKNMLQRLTERPELMERYLASIDPKYLAGPAPAAAGVPLTTGTAGVRSGDGRYPRPEPTPPVSPAPTPPGTPPVPPGPTPPGTPPGVPGGPGQPGTGEAGADWVPEGQSWTAPAEGIFGDAPRTVVGPSPFEDLAAEIAKTMGWESGDYGAARERYGAMGDIASRPVTGASLRSDPAITEASRVFDEAIMPIIQSNAQLAGLGRSSTLQNALAAGKAQYMLPLLSEGLAREERQKGVELGAAGEAATGYQGLGGARQARIEAQIPTLLGIGGLGRSIAQERSDEQRNEWLRQLALFEQAIGGPLGLAPSTIGSTASSTASGKK